MKFLILFVSILMTSTLAQAAKKNLAKDSFTAWSETPSEIWLGILKTEKGYEPEARLAHYEISSMSKKSIALPRELQGREVIRVFTATDGAVVVTQQRVEQGDKPLVNFYSKKTSAWTPLGEIPCESPLKIEAESTALNTTCERDALTTELRFPLKQHKVDVKAKSLRPIPSLETLELGQDKKPIRLEARSL